MPSVDLLCLANSRKHGGRCIAGVRADGRGWLRPVAPSRDGTLFPSHYGLGNRREPAMLDLIRIPIAIPRPGPHHPEDVVLGRGSWQLLKRPATDLFLELLGDHLDPGPELIRNRSDRIQHSSCVIRPLVSSLSMIEPKDLHWRITSSVKGARQTRALFRFQGAHYDLSVTDPVWEHLLRRLDMGEHDFDACGIGDIDTIYLTISLAEPFIGYCYKLVAAIVAVTDE